MTVLMIYMLEKLAVFRQEEAEEMLQRQVQLLRLETSAGEENPPPSLESS